MFNMFPFIFDNIIKDQGNNNQLNNARSYNNRNQGHRSESIRDNRNNGYNNYSYKEEVISINIGDVITQVAGAIVTGSTIISNTIDTLLNSESMERIANALDGKLNARLIEEDDKYIIRARLVGVQKKDIDIDYENDYINIKVKKDMTFTNGSTMFIQIQTSGDNIESSFHVPNVDENNIKAAYNSNIGLLKITMLKKYKSIESSKFENSIEEFNEIIDVEEYTEL